MRSADKKTYVDAVDERVDEEGGTSGFLQKAKTHDLSFQNLKGN